VFIKSLDTANFALKSDNPKDKRDFLENIGSNFTLGHSGGGRKATLEKESVSYFNPKLKQTHTRNASGKPDKPIFRMKYTVLWKIIAEENKNSSKKGSALEPCLFWCTELAVCLLHTAGTHVAM